MTSQEMEPRRWTIQSTWRLRLVGWALLLVTLSTVASVITLRIVGLIQIERSVESDLRLEIEELEVLARGNDPATGEPFGTDVAAILSTFLARSIPGEYETYLTFLNGEAYLRSVDDPAVRLDLLPEATSRWAGLTTPDRGEIDTAVGRVDYIAVPLLGGGDTGVFVAAAFTDLARSDAERPLLFVAGAEALAGLAVAGLVAWAFTARMVRPVSAITDTVRTITASGLSTRVPVEGNDELGRLASTFNDMLDRLDNAFASQQAFLADAGHELRTPITIIRGHLEVMGDDPVEQQRTLALVLDELDRMGRMVDDQLTLARAERPDFLQPTPADLDELLQTAFDKTRALGDRRWVIDAMAAGIVHLDTQRITQAIVALADNAVAHTQDGDEIGIGAAIDESYVDIWVRDTGSGIDADEQEAIFERFHRGARARGRPGSGLGLSIVASIVHAHGGDVTVTSQPDAGATFLMRIPRTSEEVTAR